MLNWIIAILLICVFPVSARCDSNHVNVDPEKGVLIRTIQMDGFVLGQKDRFTKLFKPYRNKYLKTSDMDDILRQIQVIYEREGYQQLVSITYKVDRHRLIFTALMIS